MKVRKWKEEEEKWKTGASKLIRTLHKQTNVISLYNTTPHTFSLVMLHYIYTVEPLYNGQVGAGFCPLFGGVLYWEVSSQ